MQNFWDGFEKGAEEEGKPSVLAAFAQGAMAGSVLYPGALATLALGPRNGSTSLKTFWKAVVGAAVGGGINAARQAYTNHSSKNDL